MFNSKNNQKKFFTSLVAILLGISLLVGTSVSAAVTSYAKWSNRVQTLYVIHTASNSHWSTGAAKWRTTTNFNVSTASGIGGANYSYYTLDVSKSDVDWDGLSTITQSNNGIISKAVLNLNTFYTSQSKYTSSIIAGVTGHEVGHSLGLNHTSVVETSSIMHPYTFNSNGTTARALSPSTSDKSVVNTLYPLSQKLGNANNTGNFSEEGNTIHVDPSWAVYYEDEEALTKAADLVVKGIVTNEIGSKITKDFDMYYNTEFSLQISEVMKGEKVTGDSITLSQMGGSKGNVAFISDHSTHLKEKQEVILFLRKSNDGTYRAINENDGIYLFENGIYINIGSKQILNEKKIHFNE